MAARQKMLSREDVVLLTEISELEWTNVSTAAFHLTTWFIVGSKMSKAPFGMDLTVNGSDEGITDGILSKTIRSWARPKRRKFVGGWWATIQRNGFTTTNTT